MRNDEIDPNISPNPLPINDNTIVSSNDDDSNNNNNDQINTIHPHDDIINANNNVTTATDTNNINNNNDIAQDETQPVNQDDKPPLSKYCDCSETQCNCCRDFSLPIIPVRGPGCARIKYLGNEKMSVTIKYGDVTLASRVISGKKAKPICIPLPGGYSNFCGRIYGLKKEKDDFKACLGLELRAEDEIEAALRVSCFKFGTKGLQLSEAEPIPVDTEKDEDDYDFFGLGGSDDDSAENDETDNEGAAGAQSDEADYDGFSLLGSDLLDGLFGDDS